MSRTGRRGYKTGVGRAVSRSPSLRTGLADFLHPALQSVVSRVGLKPLGLGCFQAEPALEIKPCPERYEMPFEARISACGNGAGLRLLLDDHGAEEGLGLAGETAQDHRNVVAAVFVAGA
jgi:hypothetical protein